LPRDYNKPRMARFVTIDNIKVMKWSGLTLKLLLGIVLIEVLMLSILVYNSVRLLSSTHAELFEQTVNDEVTLMSSLLVGGLTSMDRALIHENLQLLSKQSNVKYALVYDRRNRLVSHVGDTPGEFHQDWSFAQAEQDGVYDTQIEIKLQGQNFGLLQAGFSVTDIVKLSATAKWQNTLIALVEILLSIMATGLVGMYVINRITLLQSGAQALQEGRYDYRIPVAGEKDELDELAQAYNELGASLESSTRLLTEKQTEIEQKAARLSTLLNNLNVVIFEAFRQPFCINFINKEAEKLMGYSMEEWKLPGFMKSIAYKDDLVLLSRFAENPANPAMTSFEYRVHKKDGDLIWLRQIVNVESRLEQGFVHGILIDVTTEKRNAEVERARDIALAENRTKNLFLANMSHELRTPLNAIIGYSEFLQEENDSGTLEKESASKDLGRVIRSAKHLLSVINEILDISKINSGKLEIIVNKFNLQELIRDVTDTVRPMAEKNGNRLKVIIPADFVVHADRQRLYQILLNVCGNACKFTKNGEVEIEVAGEPEGGCYTVTVKDTGVGIRPDDVESIFDEFVRTDDVGKIEGTGLGLCLSQKLCRSMGGEILVSSIHGIGSTFTISMPFLIRTRKRA